MAERVAVLDDYQGVALEFADWGVLGDRCEVVVFGENFYEVEEHCPRLQGFEIVAAMRERTPFPRSVLERLPDLRLLVTTGGRNAVIDEDACRDLGVTVCGTGGEAQTTAELTWALLLAAARHIPAEVTGVAAGGWMTTVGSDLYRATLGLCGLGRIGGRVARVGKAFGMDIVAWSENLTPERCERYDATLVSKDELFDRADYLSIHLVLSERTRGLVGERELRRMKPNAWLVNTSRGPICDEDALVRACTEGWIAGAALDTFGTEPLPHDHPFRTLDNVLATPHIGYVTERVYRIFFHDLVEDIAAWLDGAPIRVVV